METEKGTENVIHFALPRSSCITLISLGKANCLNIPDKSASGSTGYEMYELYCQRLESLRARADR
jgi:hypothetical protein